jgi:hypothetical protein
MLTGLAAVMMALLGTKAYLLHRDSHTQPQPVSRSVPEASAPPAPTEASKLRGDALFQYAWPTITASVQSSIAASPQYRTQMGSMLKDVKLSDLHSARVLVCSMPALPPAQLRGAALDEALSKLPIEATANRLHLPPMEFYDLLALTAGLRGGKYPALCP